MADSFFFYDLETSGISASNDRIMQFAGQRTDMDLEPIGESVNVLIKLTPDVLPSPEAILITGITPQQTITDGLTEAEFLEYFYKEVVCPGTIFTGYNTIRFDDEFMRYLHYRNFYDPYEWQWKDSCSRWDMLDVVRMTRALRPLGINWPFTPEGKPTNRLELLSAANKLSHENAHDALSDVMATIALAKLIRNKQPDLFKYLLSIRNKREVARVVASGQPFVYCSGRYSSSKLHTTAAILIAKHTQQDAALVYDLCFDPTPFLKMSVEEIIECWRYNKDSDGPKLPIKTVKYNRCPAVAPLGVIKDNETEIRLALSLNTIEEHRKILAEHQAAFAEKIGESVKRLDQARFEAQDQSPDDLLNVDSRLYNRFIEGGDKQTAAKVRSVPPNEISALQTYLKDTRLQLLAPLYKARNYPASLTSEERTGWDDYCKRRLFDGGSASVAAQYFTRLAELAASETGEHKRYVLEELQLYGQSILPSESAD